MSENEMMLRALGKLIYMWSPVILCGLAGLKYIDYSDKLIEKNRQAIKRARRSEKKVA